MYICVYICVYGYVYGLVLSTDEAMVVSVVVVMSVVAVGDPEAVVRRPGDDVNVCATCCPGRMTGRDR